MSKPTIKDLQAELFSLKARHAVTQGSNDRLLKEVKRLKGSPKVQEQLNMTNKTVHDLMQEVQDLKEQKDELKQRLTEATTDKMKYYNQLAEVSAKNETLKSDYAILEEKYYTQMDCYTEVNKELTELIDKYNKVTAENYALKAQIKDTIEQNNFLIDSAEKHKSDGKEWFDLANKYSSENKALKAENERLNRHINLAENQLHREQQPLVVNHYHNCVINKGL